MLNIINKKYVSTSFIIYINNPIFQANISNQTNFLNILIVSNFFLKVT